MIKKNQLAKESADARPEIFVPGNALDAMITDLDLSGVTTVAVDLETYDPNLKTNCFLIDPPFKMRMAKCFSHQMQIDIFCYFDFHWCRRNAFRFSLSVLIVLLQTP